jgi:hypothetical protein
LPGLLDLSLKSEWKPPWPHNSWILRACKTNITWVTPRSATSFSGSWVPLHQCHSVSWVCGGLSIVKQILSKYCLCKQGAP